MSTLSEIEKRLENMYKKSRKDIASSWIAYMNRAAVRLQKLQDEYDAAKQSGDADEIRRTGIRLANAKRMATIYNDKYKDMVKQTTEKLSDLNSIALAYVNGQIPEIYYRSYNAIRTDAIKMGIDFTIINQDVIRKRVMEDNIKTPYMHLQKFLDIPKDERWNTKQLNSAVLQGILQGESMGKIAQRIYPIVNRNGAAAIRNARTMVTGAENSGRLDSYKQLEDDGVVLNKVWMSTPDGRTRDEHVDMDGEEVGIHDKFSNGCEYPGDPAGDPATVYNCRCTMVTHIIGFKKADGSISKVKYDKDRTIHDEQMEAEKEHRGNKEQKPQKIVTFTQTVAGTEEANRYLSAMSQNHAETWGNNFENTTYNVVEPKEGEVAHFDPRNGEVNLFPNSTADTIFHETSHAIEEKAVHMEVTSSSKRLRFGEWREQEPYTYGSNKVATAIDTIYSDVLENSWTTDMLALCNKIGLSCDESGRITETDDFEAFKKIREFLSETRKSIGDNAANNISDMIDGITLGKYPLCLSDGGHGQDYWMKDASLRWSEAWAEFSALKAQGDDAALEVMKEILPETYNAVNSVWEVYYDGKTFEHTKRDETERSVHETIFKISKQ